ncbi:MAG: AmmeMemoRadiSam system protein A [Pseudomonadales bacterium]|nr:AmmeMemoRadiSam system protein A [Pseudomonadales bacterium]
MVHSVSINNSDSFLQQERQLQAQQLFNDQLAMTFSPHDKETLLLQARKSIQEICQNHSYSVCDLSPFSSQLQQPMACFVTLTKNQRLRGCIGSLSAHQPLIQDVICNARAAASRDSRFNSVTEDELDNIHIEISILSPIQVITFNNEEEMLEQIRPGIDGIVLEYGQNHATFLPLVWQQINNKEDFIRELKIKAGIESDFWSDKMHVSRYQTLIIEEDE